MEGAFLLHSKYPRTLEGGYVAALHNHSASTFQRMPMNKGIGTITIVYQLPTLVTRLYFIIVLGNMDTYILPTRHHSRVAQDGREEYAYTLPVLRRN